MWIPSRAPLLLLLSSALLLHGPRASASLEARRPSPPTIPAVPCGPGDSLPVGGAMRFESLPAGEEALLVAGRDYAGRLSGTGLSLRLGPRPVELRLAGADPRAVLRPGRTLPGRTHYLHGRDPSKWRRHVPHHDGASVAGAWPGVDLLWRAAGTNLAFDLLVAPGADPERPAFALPGAAPAVDAEGALAASLPGGTLRLTPPVAWQEGPSGRLPVAARWAGRADGSFGFSFGPYDRSRPLLVDPEVEWNSTTVGGVGTNVVQGVSLAGDGSVCVAGYSLQDYAATAGAFQYGRAGGFYEATVSRIAADGTLLYTTYLGGTGDEQAWGVAAGPTGAATVHGYTNSADFPVANAMDDTRDLVDVFVARLLPDGSGLEWSTYLGGSSSDGGSDFDPDAIALDGEGNVWLAGSTWSPDFPLVDPFQETIAGQNDVFVAAIAADGQELIFSTLLGGTRVETAMGLAAHPDGGVVVTGRTNSLDFPRVGGFAGPGLDGGQFAWVARIDGEGDLLWSTYLGDLVYWVSGVAVDADGGVFVAGSTNSATFPSTDSFQPELGGVEDAFLVKILPDGSDRAWATFLGGPYSDRAYGVTVDGEGCPWLGGYTQGEFPEVHPLPGNDDPYAAGFVARFRPDGSGLLFSSRIVGAQVNEIAVSPAGVAYLSNMNGGLSGGRTNYGVVAVDLGSLAVSPALVLDGIAGQVLDSPKPGRDRVRATASLSLEGGPFALGGDPAAEPVTIRLGAPGDPLELVIPAADAGWKIRNGTMKWKSPRGAAGARWSVVIDERRGRLQVSATKADLPAAATGDVLLGLSGAFGDGEDVSPWTLRRPGLLVRKR